MKKIKKSVSSKFLSLFLTFLLIVGLFPGGIISPSQVQAADEIAALRATVVFSTTTPKSGEEFFMDIRANSGSLGGESGLIENLHIEFDLPSNLSVVKSPTNSAYTVTVTGQHVAVDYNSIVPIGAAQQLRFVLAWKAGVTVEGTDVWATPQIHLTADNCVAAVATGENGTDPVLDVDPKNNPAITYMKASTEDVYAAYLHTATVELKNEGTIGGLNLQNGKVTIDLDSATHVEAIKLNGVITPFTVLANTPGPGRKSIVINVADSTAKVGEGKNVLEIIYNYPPCVVIGVPDVYDMYINYTAERKNGDAINETGMITEQIEYAPGEGPATDLFEKKAPASFVRVQNNPLSWMISFKPLETVKDVVVIDAPKQNEADFFDAFRFSRVEVTAFDPRVTLPNVDRVRTKVFYESSGAPGTWVPVPDTEIITPGNYQWSWSGSSLTSSVLGLGADYVTRLKFEFYRPDGTTTEIPRMSGEVQIRLTATSTSGITDDTTPNSYNNDKKISNTITAEGILGSTPFNASDVTIKTDTDLTLNRPILYWEYQNNDWFYANGGINLGGWSVNDHTGEWGAVNTAGGSTGLLKIGDEAWVVERWLIEGGYFHDPIVYFYVPDPNIEILGVATGGILSHSNVEYFNAPGGGTIVKYTIKNTNSGVPGNPAVLSPTPGWDSYLPAFGPGDPGGYGWGWGHWWPRYDEIAIKVKFKSGAENSSISGAIQAWMTSGDPEQLGSSTFSPLNTTHAKLVEVGAAEYGQTILASRPFHYNIDMTEGLNPVATVSADNITYAQTKTIDNSTAPVDVYLKMNIENPASQNYGNFTKIRLIDMLPNAGDTMTISNAPKASSDSLTGYEVFSVKVNGTVIPFADLAAAGIRVYYSTTADFVSNRNELRNVTAAVAPHWTQTTNGLIPNGAKAVMIEKDGLPQGDTFEVILKATAPADTNTNKYWHSVAAGGHYSASNIVPGEPLKSGFTGLGSNVVSVSGRVWNDANKNGIQDIGEAGYPGVELRLFDDQNNQVDSTISGANGEYIFSGDFEPSSTWHIEFTLPQDYALTIWRALGSTETTNSDYIMYQGTPSVFFTFNSQGDDITYLDAGIYDNTINYYTVTYHTNTPTGATGGSVPSPIINIPEGDPAQLSAATAVPTRTDGTGTYTFKGWSLTPGAAVDASINYNGTGIITSVTSNIDLYAVWVFTPNNYTLYFDPNGGNAGSVTSKSVTYGLAVGDLPGDAAYSAEPNDGKPTRTGYTFQGWSTTSGSSNTVDFTKTYVYDRTQDMTVYAVWEPRTDIAYTVEHYQQDLNAATYTKVDTDNLNGTTGGAATVTAKTYTGFAYQSAKTTYQNSGTPAATAVLSIAADGSLIVKLYYDRNTYTVTYKEGTKGDFVDDVHSNQQYGTNTPAFAGPLGTDSKPKGQPGYTFVGWAPTVAATVTENATYVAQWEANADTPYKVEHYKQDLNAATYTLTDTEDLTGTTDGPATVTPMSYTGFTYQSALTTYEDSNTTASATELVIAGDGSLIVKLYYDRNIYTVTYQKGTKGDFVDDVHSNLQYGTDTPDYAGPLGTDGKPKGLKGYTFKGWLPLVDPIVTEDAIYVAQWEKNAPPTPTTVPTTNLPKPKTGDPGVPSLWIWLCLTAAAVCIALPLLRKRPVKQK